MALQVFFRAYKEVELLHYEIREIINYDSNNIRLRAGRSQCQ